MYMIGYTSESGVTIGAVSDSFVGAVAQLADEFGEEFVHLYGHARQELLAEIEAVDATEASDTTLLDELQQQADARAAVAAAEPSSGDDVAVGDAADGGGSEGVPARASDDVAVEPPSDPVIRCKACGEAIGNDIAKASTLMVGEPRCGDCMVL